MGIESTPAVTSTALNPRRGEAFTKIEQRAAQNAVVARIDANGDGKFNYGQSYGDTVKVFNFEQGIATGDHLVKRGEVGTSVPAGQIEHSEVPLGRSLKKTFDGLTHDEIRAKVPGAILVHPKGGKTFEPGATIMFKSKDGTRYNIHYVSDGELPAKTAKMTGAKDIKDVKSDKGIQAGEICWYTMPKKSE